MESKVRPHQYPERAQLWEGKPMQSHTVRAASGPSLAPACLPTPHSNVHSHPRPSPEALPWPSQTRATYPAVHVPLALGHAAHPASTPSPSWPKTERKGRNLGRRVRAPGPHGQTQKPAGVALPSPWTSLGGLLGYRWGQRWGLRSKSPLLLEDS